MGCYFPVVVYVLHLGLSISVWVLKSKRIFINAFIQQRIAESFHNHRDLLLHMNINNFGEKVSHRPKNIRHSVTKYHAGLYMYLCICAVHMLIVYVNLHAFLYKGMYIYSYKLSYHVFG